MSWVLILASNVTGRIPAVVGGYKTRKEAEAAGELATGWVRSAYAPMPHFTKFVVIPGAACTEPIGGTHSEIERDQLSPVDHEDYGKPVRRTQHFRLGETDAQS